MWTIFEVFIDYNKDKIAPVLWLVFFFFFFFDHEGCRILASKPGIKPTHSALEGEVLTTGLPGRGNLNTDMDREKM